MLGTFKIENYLQNLISPSFRKFQKIPGNVKYSNFFQEQGLKHVICCVEFRALCFAETHRYILCCYALFEIGLHDRVLMFGAHCCLGNMSHKAAF